MFGSKKAATHSANMHFVLIWCPIWPATQRPIVKTTMEEAEKEIAALASKNPGVLFFILEPVGAHYIVSNTPSADKQGL